MTYGEAYLEGWKNIFNYEGVSNRFASFILTLIFAVPAIALAVRRMHDIGYSGWWVTIVVLIPVTGVILLILCCLPSKSQDQA